MEAKCGGRVRAESCFLSKSVPRIAALGRSSEVGQSRASRMASIRGERVGTSSEASASALADKASSQAEAEELIALMGDKLLANPVSELFDFEVDQA